MRVLITGSGGMVGAALLAELQGDGGLEMIAPRRAELDLMDGPATRAAFADARPELVFHLAAKVAGLGGNMAEPAAMFYENVIINTNVVEAARRAGARKLIAVGSTAIYSDIVTLPMSEDDLWLGPPHASEAPYGHAKRALLAHLDACKRQYGMDYAYCILTNTFGPHDTFDEQYGHVLPSLISKFHRAANTGEPVTIWGTGTPKRDFLYSKDVARALRAVAERADGPLNLASGREVTIRELVGIVARASGYDGEVRWDAAKPNGQELRQYDIGRLQATGFEPAYTLEQAVVETYSWYAAHAGGVDRSSAGLATPDRIAPTS